MKKYEIMYIVNPSLDQDQTKKVVESVNAIFTNNESKVLEVKELGLKDLAYEINHNRKGYYVWAEVEANNQAVNEFNRILGYDENILRYIIVVEK
jgi:small subunit ribosomal protein S6